MTAVIDAGRLVLRRRRRLLRIDFATFNGLPVLDFRPFRLNLFATLAGKRADGRVAGAIDYHGDVVLAAERGLIFLADIAIAIHGYFFFLIFRFRCATN